MANDVIGPVPDGVLAEERELPPLDKTLTDLDEELIVKEIMAIKKRSEEYYAGRRSKWLDFFNHYVNKKREKTRSTIPVPISSEHVDVVLADIVSRQFATRPFCGVRGRNDDDQQFAPIIEALIQYQFDQMDIFDVFMQAVKSALIYGSAPYRVFYDKEYLDVPLPGVGGKRRILHYCGPRITVYDIFDYFPDSSKIHPNDPAPSVVRSYRPFEYFEEKQDLYPHLYKNAKDIPHKRQVAMDTDDLQARQERQTALGMSPEPTEQGLVEVLEADIWWPVQKRDGTWINRPCIFTVANGKLIRATRNVYVSQNGNMGLVCIDRVPNDLFGMGLVEKLHPQQHGANTVLDMILTNLELTVDKMLVINTEQIKREDELHNRSGGVIHVRGDVNSAMRWSDAGSIVPDAYLMFQNFKGASENASGVKPVKQGTVAADTATAVNAAQMESGTRFNLYMMMIEHTFVKPAASMMHRINQQFLDLPTVIPVLGQKLAQQWPVVDAEVISMDADFVPEGSMREMNKQMNIAQIENFLAIISKVPGLQPLIPMMVGKLAREFRWQDANEIQALCERAVQQQMMMEQLMAQMQGGAGNPAPGGSLNQSTSPGNIAGESATNNTDLQHSMDGKFGVSAFS
jgi:hypothetical protein